MKGFILGVLLTAAAFVAWPRVQAALTKKGAVTQRSPVYESIQTWMTERLADKHAEIIEVSEALLVEGRLWRDVRIRATSPMGGPVFVDYAAQFDAPATLVKMWTTDELIRSEVGAAMIDARSKLMDERKAKPAQ